MALQGLPVGLRPWLRPRPPPCAGESHLASDVHQSMGRVDGQADEGQPGPVHGRGRQAGKLWEFLREFPQLRKFFPGMREGREHPRGHGSSVK